MVRPGPPSSGPVGLAGEGHPAESVDPSVLEWVELGPPAPATPVVVGRVFPEVAATQVPVR